MKREILTKIGLALIGGAALLGAGTCSLVGLGVLLSISGGDDEPSSASTAVSTSQPAATATAVVDISATATITALSKELQAIFTIGMFREAYDKFSRYNTDPTATEAEGCQLVFDLYVRYRYIQENEIGSDKLDEFIQGMEREIPAFVVSLENDYLPLIQECQAEGYLP